MIHPAPTTKIDPTLARGTLLEVNDATATKPASVMIEFPNNSYQSVFETNDDLESLRPMIGEMVMGRISVQAKRVDRPQAGGRRLDPCYGTLRRVMGTVVGFDPNANVLAVDAGAVVLLTLTAPGQNAKDFADAEFVACDVLPGALFTFQK